MCQNARLNAHGTHPHTHRHHASTGSVRRARVPAAGASALTLPIWRIATSSASLFSASAARKRSMNINALLSLADSAAAGRAPGLEASPSGVAGTVATVPAEATTNWVLEDSGSDDGPLIAKRAWPDVPPKVTFRLPPVADAFGSSSRPDGAGKGMRSEMTRGR